MNVLTLAWRNLLDRPLRSLLSLLLFALGTGLVAFLLLFQDQLDEQFEANLAGIDLVIGAKGSPLQLVLSTMYYVDAPTGNVPIGKVKPFLNPAHPLIATAVPLSIGDSYRNHRIVGTTEEFLGLYGAELSEGNWPEDNFEVVVGSLAARDTKLKPGDTFETAHGLDEEIGAEHEGVPPLRVVGLLAPTGTVADQLLLTTPATYWLSHGDHSPTPPAETDDEEEPAAVEEDHEHAESEEHEHGANDAPSGHEDHNHADEHAHTAPVYRTAEELAAAAPEQEITALLLKFKGRNYQALNMGRSINENTDLQAATPAIETTRVFQLFDQSERALRLLALIIMIVSALSVFISLYSSLRDRRYELALLRVMGASRPRLFGLITFEGVLLALVGCVAGILLAHGALWLLANNLREAYRYEFSAVHFLPGEAVLLGASLLIGLVAALLPAAQAARADVGRILSND